MNKKKAIRIRTLAQVKRYAKKDGGQDFCISNGFIRSSKNISYEKGEKKPFYIFNEIDGSQLHLTEKQFMNPRYSNIPTAMANGAFFKYPW